MLNQDKMPGAGSVADTIEFMKKMWSSMGAPAMAAPSLSVEDINKKISDLKTVASWLELNLNMLKATIQTLEVQSATLSTLQAMSAIMASRGRRRRGPADDEGRRRRFPFGFRCGRGQGASLRKPLKKKPKPWTKGRTLLSCSGQPRDDADAEAPGAEAAPPAPISSPPSPTPMPGGTCCRSSSSMPSAMP
jgi:hypothetical protein